MRLFTGTVTFYNPDAQSDSDYPSMITDHIIIAGESYSDAANNITKYYGEDDVDNITLEVLNPEAPIITFETSDVVRLVKEEGVIY